MAKSLSLIVIILIYCFPYLHAQPSACNRTCGNITFHYPFTISGRDCRGLPGYEITCSTEAKNSHFEKANTPYLLPRTPPSLEIVEFSFEYIRVVSNQFFALPCSNDSKFLRLSGQSPFKISANNLFVTIGCHTKAQIQLFDGSNKPFTASSETGCPVSTTSNPSSKGRLPCKANGCYYVPLPQGFYEFNLSAEFSNSSISQSCDDSGSVVVDKTSWKSIQNSKTTNLSDAIYSMKLAWAIPSSDMCAIINKSSSYECVQEAICEDLYFGYVCTCPDGYVGDGYKNGTGCTASCSIKISSSYKSYKCAEEAECEDIDLGYVCKCRKGYKGDGYINGSGCKASCSIGKNSSSYECAQEAECKDQYYPRYKDLYWRYLCSCPKGYEGDGYKNSTGCRASNYECSFGANCKFQTLSVITGACAAFVVALIGGGALLWLLKQRNLKLAKKRNFDRNGGAELQRLLSSRGVESTRLFSLDEIAKATNDFSQSLVLGSGGYGTVYKGTVDDGTIVAVKKSKEIDAKEIDQFVNEVVILSQINHRNVVKILGCCLETPVPLLVYEYISNGTLFELLHGENYEDHPLVWEDRLRIATETAEALSYLHSATSTPVVHRDVKSSNILLDDAYNPKVADFGVSRLVPMGQTHVTTVVQGTLGYLDPEYFQTIQLTEKSDVYSFGVVLVELLTGLKPVSYERMKNQSNLAIFFLSTLKSNGLIGIIDPRLNAEESRNMESMRRVANLAKECLSVEGEKRPAMKEVVHDLLYIRNGTRNHPWLDVDAVQNEEEMISLIAAHAEQSDETKGNRATAQESYCTTSVPFSIERLRGGNSGR